MASAIITEDTLDRIVGSRAPAADRALLRAASLHVGNVAGAFLTTDHMWQISAIATEISAGLDLVKLDRVFEDFDGVMKGRKLLFAEVVAEERWTPVVRAAYYFGLSLGLRLAGSTGKGGA